MKTAKSIRAIFAAGILSLCIIPSAAAQVPENDGVMDDPAIAAIDGGFAPGEVPPRTIPYEPPASQPSVAEAITPAPSDWYGQWQQWKADLAKKTGTSFELFLNPSDQFIVTGASDDDGLNRGVLWFNFHLEQQLWPGGRIMSNTRGGHGDGVNRYVDSLFNFNQHAGETTCPYVSHLFYDQKLFGDKVTIDIGKLDLLDWFDENEVNGWNMIPYSLARNPSIPAPYHVLGARVRFDPAEWVYVQAGVADAGGRHSETGFNTVFDEDEPYFSIAEIAFKPKFLDRPGTYRAMVWHNCGDISRFDGGTESGDTGFALSFDQQITDQLGAAFRYGWSDPEVRRINHYVSFGLSYSEPLPGRKRDVAGASVAVIFQSDDFRDVVPGIESTAAQFDFYYKIAVTPWFNITPDLQVIVHPDQHLDEDIAVIAGVWAELTF
jgi:carbohydrate-selective porin OprB